METLDFVTDRYIATADLHLTSNPADSYRWDVFPWLADVCKQRDVDTVFILGDLSDYKDEHPAPYVNRLVDALAELAKTVRVVFMTGNHDYIDYRIPYFTFLSKIPNIHVVIRPTSCSNGEIILLPHTRTPEESWKHLDLSEANDIFIHQPVIGSVSSDFYELEHGMNPKYFSENHPKCKAKIWAGDIHIPQVVGDIEYIGPPYPVRFGDKIEGRVVLVDIDNDKEESVIFNTIQKAKLKVKSSDDFADKIKDLKKGDKVKIDVDLGSDPSNWQEEKRKIVALCEENGLEYYGAKLVKAHLESIDDIADDEVTQTIEVISDSEAIKLYAERRNLPKDTVKIGLEIAQC